MSCPAEDAGHGSSHCTASSPAYIDWLTNPWVAAIVGLGVAVCILYHQSKQTALKARASAPAKPLIASALDSHQDAKVLATASCCQSNGPSGRDTCCSASGKALALSSAALTACACQSTHDPASAHTLPEIIAMYYQQPLKVFYGTQTGTAKLFANQLGETLKAQNLPATVLDVADYDTEDFFTEKSVCLFLLATYNVENPTDWLLKWLEDTRYDHRVAKGSLSHLRYAVFGLGDSAYSDEFGFAGRAADKGFGTLGARRMYPLGEGDKNEDQLASFEAWQQGIVATLLDPTAYSGTIHAETRLSDSELDADACDGSIGSDENDGTHDGAQSNPNVDVLGDSGSEMVDVEDMGRVAHKIQTARQQRQEDEARYAETYGSGSRRRGANGAEKPRRIIKRSHRVIGQSTESASNEKPVVPRAPREMVSPMIHQNLTKQGYKVIGTHSGVKICRWTKSALRGRGFCYKHSFYGIQSHLCMETTPSLACANKCVFCWRHHTNPVGTEWRWQMDDPGFILDGALDNHYRMIKQLKGVPGVKAERFQEAFQVKHCALSLVGEPIMYPRINEFVKMLHCKGISSFLVTNAQFPDKIAELEPITQLYVSVDASTKESLKKVDRPLFRDFWERFMDSLDSLRQKGQRTVYRLTLVKAFNTDELDNYVGLVRRGQPDFIEVKGVTYCGFSGASNLTMENVPYHNEVVYFVQQITDMLGGDYEIACEHAHSCSVLIAHKKFKVEGQWHTWIDYSRFQELVASDQPFTSLDYMAPTPDWAIFGNEHHGFDPLETRFYRKKKGAKKTAD